MKTRTRILAAAGLAGALTAGATGCLRSGWEYHNRGGLAVLSPGLTQELVAMNDQCRAAPGDADVCTADAFQRWHWAISPRRPDSRMFDNAEVSESFMASYKPGTLSAGWHEALDAARGGQCIALNMGPSAFATSRPC
jgi:hypothetical protein